MTLQEALKHFKNKAELADALDISRQAIWKWDKESIPEAQALKLQYEIIPNLTKAKESAA